MKTGLGGVKAEPNWWNGQWQKNWALKRADRKPKQIGQEFKKNFYFE